MPEYPSSSSTSVAPVEPLTAVVPLADAGPDVFTSAKYISPPSHLPYSPIPLHQSFLSISLIHKFIPLTSPSTYRTKPALGTHPRPTIHIRRLPNRPVPRSRPSHRESRLPRALAAVRLPAPRQRPAAHPLPCRAHSRRPNVCHSPRPRRPAWRRWREPDRDLYRHRRPAETANCSYIINPTTSSKQQTRRS